MSRLRGHRDRSGGWPRQATPTPHVVSRAKDRRRPRGNGLLQVGDVPGPHLVGASGHQFPGPATHRRLRALAGVQHPSAAGVCGRGDVLEAKRGACHRELWTDLLLAQIPMLRQFATFRISSPLLGGELVRGAVLGPARRSSPIPRLALQGAGIETDGLAGLALPSAGLNRLVHKPKHHVAFLVGVSSPASPPTTSPVFF